MVGQAVFVRTGEVIPLDGVLVSEMAEVDESSLTGEPYMMEKLQGNQLRSGTVNTGHSIVVQVTTVDAQSTYRKIIDMVKQAQDGQAPLIRLADRYSSWFTIITLILAVVAYLISHDISRVLAVLVIATPCPLLIATPIALLGGMNLAARQKIILKQLGALEVLSRIDTLIFDKTGTLTLGQPRLMEIDVRDATRSEVELLAIAASLERNSLHPIAKAVVMAAEAASAPRLIARSVTETVGKGIAGDVDGVTYTLAKHHGDERLTIALQQGEQVMALFFFEDELKADAKTAVAQLHAKGLRLHVFTGDKAVAAQRIVDQLSIGHAITLKANCTPQDKLDGVKALQENGHVVAMIGDGINDAPALALADVGVVFSNEEHTAASEAADVVLLGGDFAFVWNILAIARRTIRIALQSIWVGIGLSILGMVLALFGFIPPIVGAGLQEAIDILVIFNALRASR
jgi:heavy metal translocating P-type ATPase